MPSPLRASLSPCIHALHRCTQLKTSYLVSSGLDKQSSSKRLESARDISGQARRDTPSNNMLSICQHRRRNGTLFAETLCIDDPFTFVCKWIGSGGDVIDSPTRPGNNYLQVAGTTSLDAYYHTMVKISKKATFTYDGYEIIHCNAVLLMSRCYEQNVTCAGNSDYSTEHAEYGCQCESYNRSQRTCRSLHVRRQNNCISGI